jgi:lambda family phage portal protein
MNLLDRAISIFSPEAGLRRALARQTLDAVRGYEGAKNTRRTKGWRPGREGPNTEVARARTTLRDRSRDLVRSNPWAADAVTKLVDYQIGTGIRPRARTGNKALDKRVNKAFAEWAAKCDVTGELDFWNVQAAIARSRIEAGEGLALLVKPTAAEMRQAGLKVPLQLQLVEPDLLAGNWPVQASAPGNRVLDGVEITPQMRRVAYHLYAEHPGEMIYPSVLQRTEPVPAERVLHIYRADRVGQLRGVPDMAAGLMRLRMLDELEDAVIEQAKVAALLAAFTVSQGGAGMGPMAAAKDGETGERRRTMSPGMIHALAPGEDVKFNAPPSAGGVPEHLRHQLRAFAAVMGLPYDLLTGDLTQANYSSLRAGRLAFKRRLEVLQWMLLIPKLCQPIWDAWVQAAIMAGVLPERAGGYPCEWGPPRFELLDPLAEAKGIEKEIRLGLKTEPQAISEAGWDPDEQLDEITAWNARKDAVGIVTDSDPRKVAGNGQVQSLPADPAAADTTASTGA